jgi:hypothetical protein
MHNEKALTHDENREKVCAVCMNKAKYTITDCVLERIKTYFIENFDIEDPCLPSGICAKCRSDLLDISNGKKDTTILPDAYDFSEIVPQYLRSTRANTNPLCHCHMCDIARQKLTSIPHRKKGRPSSDLNNTSIMEKQSIIRLCSSCKSPVRRGLPHKCNVSSLRENISQIFDEADERTQEIIASMVIKKKALSEGNSVVRLATKGPTPLPMRVYDAEENIPPTFSAASLGSLQTSLGASNTTMKRKLIPFIRNIAGKRAVEASSEKYFQCRDKSLEDFFTLSLIEFESNSENCSSTPFVYCNDVDNFINHICAERNTDSENVDIKFGIDGGGGFFKVCLTIHDKNRRDAAGSTHNMKMVDQMSLDTSVKKIFIIAIAPEIKETYCNVKTVLDQVKIENLDMLFTFAVDLKLANIIGGIQAHGCSYPCIWCECPKAHFHEPQNGDSFALRTIGSVRKNVNGFHEASLKTTEMKKCKQAQARDFKSCVHEPLLKGGDDDLVLTCLPPSELHLLLRVTNKLYDELQSLSAEVANKWTEALGLTRPKMHSGEFNGNMCKRLLNHTSKLQEIAAEAGRSEEVYPYVKTFKAFNEVTSSCFGEKLSTDFVDLIQKFQEAYLELNISVTTAVHVVFKHVPQFCQLVDTGLGQFSEQASESVHYDFNHMWEKSGKVSLVHAAYGSNLLQAIIRYNGRHI